MMRRFFKTFARFIIRCKVYLVNGLVFVCPPFRKICELSRQKLPVYIIREKFGVNIETKRGVSIFFFRSSLVKSDFVLFFIFMTIWCFNESQWKSIESNRMSIYALDEYKKMAECINRISLKLIGIMDFFNQFDPNIFTHFPFRYGIMQNARSF